MDMNSYTEDGLSPKDKALELYDRFQSKSPKMGDHSIVYISTALHHARLCVDEILNEIKKTADEELVIPRVIYWEKVKQELEVLY